MKSNVSKLFCAIVLSFSVIAGAVFGPAQIAAAGTGGAGGGIGGQLRTSVSILQ